MKTILSSPSTRKQSQKGSAVLIVIILLGVMLVLIASNTKNLNHLKHELDLIEQKQLKRQAESAVPVAAPRPVSRQP